MGEKAQEQEVQITDWNKKETSSPQPATIISRSNTSNLRRFEWRILITLFILFILLGQAAAVLLGRLYYNNGGKSKWMATLVQIVAFPVLLPLYKLVPKKKTENDTPTTQSSVYKIASFYIFIGLFLAGMWYGLYFSLTQFAFQRIIKKTDFKATVDMIVYPAFVASLATVVGLLVSGDWKMMKTEMHAYELGKVSYVMTLVWTALTWQLYSIGIVGLINKVSSLFSNVVATLGLPIVPVLAVIFFHDSMDGVKVVAMVLAIWGFVSYGYQQYLDYCKPETENNVPTFASEI
ncbi:hypothetical protein KSS87_001225 [Heliosperma pusillum]|nr:hypothetical protein KSS87_001225 [Heliosperma pusillum]